MDNKYLIVQFYNINALIFSRIIVIICNSTRIYEFPFIQSSSAFGKVRLHYFYKLSRHKTIFHINKQITEMNLKSILSKGSQTYTTK